MAAADVSISARPYSHDPSALNPSGPYRANRPPRDDLDDLFNFDAETNNVLGDVDEPAEREQTNARKRRQSSVMSDALGIDEEINIKKARAPQPKLDDERLLSQKGIPRLRENINKRMKYKGKGHEFSDVQRLLNMYQLWLDDLFPKAKFADGLMMVEKLGHSKRLKTMRQEWINETKPKPDIPDASDEDAVSLRGDDDQDARRGQSGDSEPNANSAMPGEQDSNQNPSTDEAGSGLTQDDDDDLTDEFLYGRPDRGSEPRREKSNSDEAEGDELDMLLEEMTGNGPVTSTAESLSRPPIDDFADEEEAMAGMW